MSASSRARSGIGVHIGFTIVEFRSMDVNALKLKDAFKYYQPGFLVILSSMLFFGSALCWLFISGKLKRFFSSMQVIGKMTLTNYIVQNFIAIFLFSGAGLSLSLDKRIHYGYYLLFAFVIFIAQLYFSKSWLSKYYYGPIEWLWRQLSYGKRLELKKKAEPILNLNIEN